jgi:hypothetical protein
MQLLNGNRLKIIERLRQTMKQANEWKDNLDKNAYLWLDDRNEHMRQFLIYARCLEGFIVVRSIRIESCVDDCRCV